MAVGVVQQTTNQAFSVAATLFNLSKLGEGQAKQTGEIEKQTTTIESLKKQLEIKQREIDDIPLAEAIAREEYSKHLDKLIEDPDELEHNLEEDLLKEYKKSHLKDSDPKADAKFMANEIRNRYNQIRGTGFAEAEADYLPEIDKLNADKAEAERAAEDFEIQAALKEEEAAEANRRAEGNRAEANAWRSKQFRGINRQDEMANKSLLNAQIKKQKGARYR